jgi:uncharacterized protein (TIGR03083 family)
MSSVLDDYDVTASAVERLIRRAGKDDWDKPTPCTDWTVRGLVNHIVTGNLRVVVRHAGRAGAGQITRPPR